MKTTLVILSVLVSAQAFATVCTSEATKGRATFMETPAGVEVTLADKNFTAGNTIGQNPTFQVGFKASTTLLIEKATLPQVVNTSVAKEALASLLISMPDDGDRDLAYFYASEFIDNLKCTP